MQCLLLNIYFLHDLSPVFSQIPGPNHVENRYLTEDIAYGLVLWSSLGRVIDVLLDHLQRNHVLK
jgi:hypothetical protein